MDPLDVRAPLHHLQVGAELFCFIVCQEDTDVVQAPISFVVHDSHLVESFLSVLLCFYRWMAPQGSNIKNF